MKLKDKVIKISLLILTLIITYSFFVCLKSLKMEKTKLAEVKDNNQKISELKSDIKDLKNELENSDSPQFVEKVAREEFGMVKPREIVYINKNKKNI